MSYQPTSIKTDLFRFVSIKNSMNIPEKELLRTAITAPAAAFSELPTAFNEDKALFAKYVAPLTTAQEVRDINPNLYDFAANIYQYRQANSAFSVEHLEVLPLSVEAEIDLWKQLFYQTVTNAAPLVGDACTQLLFANFVLKNIKKDLEEEEIIAFTHSKIVIPTQVVALRQEMLSLRCDNGGLMGVTKLGIADYLRVEQELCCYVPGEVSHIENIMAKEYKERSTRDLTRSETITEFSSDTEIENLSDTSSVARHELHNEVAQVLQTEANFNASTTGSVSYGVEGGPQASVTAQVGLSAGTNSSFSDTTAKTFAEETTRRALERVVRKVSEKRTSKMIREFEASQKHGFDNRLLAKVHFRLKRLPFGLQIHQIYRPMRCIELKIWLFSPQNLAFYLRKALSQGV